MLIPQEAAGGDDRVLHIETLSSEQPLSEICQQVMKQVTAVSQAGSAPDDRTLLAIRFILSKAAMAA